MGEEGSAGCVASRAGDLTGLTFSFVASASREIGSVSGFMEIGSGLGEHSMAWFDAEREWLRPDRRTGVATVDARGIAISS